MHNLHFHIPYFNFIVNYLEDSRFLSIEIHMSSQIQLVNTGSYIPDKFINNKGIYKCQ